jgi:hypothetical protein
VASEGEKKQSGPGSTLGDVSQAHGIGVAVEQVVDAVPVLDSEPAVPGVLGERPGRGLIGWVAPRTQSMVVAASGFVAGAAVVGLAARRRGRGSRALAGGVGRGARKQRRAGELVRIVGTRSLLVDVHLLDGAER